MHSICRPWVISLAIQLCDLQRPTAVDTTLSEVAHCESLIGSEMGCTPETVPEPSCVPSSQWWWDGVDGATAWLLGVDGVTAWLLPGYGAVMVWLPSFLWWDERWLALHDPAWWYGAAWLIILYFLPGVLQLPLQASDLPVHSRDNLALVKWLPVGILSDTTGTATISLKYIFSYWVLKSAMGSVNFISCELLFCRCRAYQWESRTYISLCQPMGVHKLLVLSEVQDVSTFLTDILQCESGSNMCYRAVITNVAVTCELGLSQQWFLLNWHISYRWTWVKC